MGMIINSISSPSPLLENRWVWLNILSFSSWLGISGDIPQPGAIQEPALNHSTKNKQCS